MTEPNAAKRRDEEIERLIVAALAKAKVDSATLLIDVPLPQDAIDRLLERPEVGGIISRPIKASSADAAHPTSPPRLERTVLIVQRNRVFGARPLVDAVRRGARRFIWISPRHLPYVEYGVVCSVLREVRAGLISRLDRWLRLHRSRILLERSHVRAFRKLHLETVPVDAHRQANGPIINVTGSLGPGGSERQLALSVLGLRSKWVAELRVICLHHLEASHEFFADGLRREGIAIDDDLLTDLLVAKGANNSADLARINEAFPVDSAFGDLVWAFACKFVEYHPSVVHCWLDPINIAAGVAAALCGVPKIVLGCRSMAPIYFQLYESNMWAGYRELLRLPNVVMLNNSAAGARDYAGWLGIDPGRIAVVPNALDMSLENDVAAEAVASFRRRFNLDAGPVVGMIGRMSEEKRPLLWIDIAQQVLASRPDAWFLWIGDGPMRAALVARARQYGMADRLILPGIMKDVAVALSAMTVFLLTSRMEGLPNVLIEAQRFGIPVVTAAVGGAPEALDEGVSGRSVKGDRAQDFAKEVLTFIDTPLALAKTKLAGPRFVRERFSVDRMINQTIAVYRGS